LLSCVGDIGITRRYWKCQCGSEGSYAVDDILGVDGRLSRTLQKHACRLTADLSFAVSAEHLLALLGVSVCAETLRTLSEHHGKAMARFQPQDDATAEAFREADGEVEFTVDAGKVNTREVGWKDVKVVVIQKRESGESVSPTTWEEQRLPAPTMRLAFARIAPAKRFQRCWRPWLRQLGVTQFGEVHVLGDGASWIWKSVDRVLTGCVQTLDIFHVCERLSQTADGVFGEQTAESRSAFEHGRSLLLELGWQGVCRWVGELLAVADEKELERRRAITNRVIMYCSKHVGRLNYAERLASGRAIGSGAVEGQAKTLGLRLKARGARWNLKNVRPMASLVCVRHSNQWGPYWLAA
jgi:hypothetical protein